MGYVIEQIIREAPEFSDFYFYRTHAGAEIDLVLLTASGKKAAIEIKFSIAPKISKGFYEACKDLAADYRYVLTPNSETYLKNDGIKVMSLTAFLEGELGDLV